MNYLVACDLDNTLLDSQYNISEACSDTIRAFTAAGNLFVIATGRLDHDIVYVEKHIGLAGNYRISQNGAIIKDSNNKTLQHLKIAQPVLQPLSQFLAAMNIRFEVSDADHRYFPSPRPADMVGEFVDSSIVDPNMSERIGIDIFPSTFLIFGNETIFAEIRCYVESNFSEAIIAIMTSPTSLEIIPRDVSKGNALAYIQQLEVIGISNTAAIGDSENDVSMFAYAKYSFAMTHAHNDVKQEAAYIMDDVADCINFLKEEQR
ncbi:Cof-type HAD-IIB family hydrolase [Culicoidibacter larvae]|uniref:HAD family hydrolase n=1 Tax=Culicoidibacter larvae TaxID=2579976 RepID=A0A5R8QFH5_9FIRM|nr:Cof-type HAD-IIB family hydrolase [Culicoidibacter larvae]TLG75419.1 HAD family hydrolase [Culicoidibacter larvae]